MLRRSKLFWKLSGLGTVTIVVVFGAVGYVGSTLDERRAIEAARDDCRFNAETILGSLKRQMMSRDNAAIDELIDDLTREAPVYRDIRLVSHGGEVAASRVETDGRPVEPTAPVCRVCHDLDDPLKGTAVRSHDRILVLPDGERAVSVVTPILSEPSCSTAACHAHAESGLVLGLLETEFSLAPVDALIAARRVQTLIAIGIAILLCSAATWFTLKRLVERPMRELASGMARVAASDFGFRFGPTRKDELGLLASTFDGMTGKLEASLTELRETRDYLEGIVENSADIIITVSPSGRIETLNAGAESALGYRRAEVIGQRIEMLFADPRERDVAIDRLADTDNVVNYETHFKTREGEIRDVLLTLSRLRDPDGNPIGTFGISKDVTNEKRLQRELIQSERLAAVGQALTGIQHSMRNMLNALQGGSYLVRTGLKKSDMAMLEEGWEMVREGIASMTAFSSNMLDYVKHWTPDLHRADPGEILSRVHRMVRRTAEDDGVSLRLASPDSPLPPIWCDSELIHSAVMDIVTNAVAACLARHDDREEPLEVVMSALVDDDHVVMEVRDNGCGMTDEVRANIFAPFFSTSKATGTGLGLAIVSRIVQVHSGRIEVESEPCRGSTFRILVPVPGPGSNRGGE